MIISWDSCRISRLLRAKLEEAGYADDLKDFAKGEFTSIVAVLFDGHGLIEVERARQQEDPKLDALLADVMAKARGKYLTPFILLQFLIH